MEFLFYFFLTFFSIIFLLFHFFFIILSFSFSIFYFLPFSVDISIDRAIRVACPTQKILVCISNSTVSSVIYHPNGRILQNNLRIDLVAFDGTHQNNLLRYAKIWQKGISFMAKDVPVVYLVDEAGLRSSVDHFIQIKKDYAFEVFNGYKSANNSLYDQSLNLHSEIAIKLHIHRLTSLQIFFSCSRSNRSNSHQFDEAMNLLQKSVHTHELNGSETVEINQVRIISHNDGTIR